MRKLMICKQSTTTLEIKVLQLETIGLVASII